MNDVYMGLYEEFFKEPKHKKYKGRPVEVRTKPKIKRNDLCPCGSNKKYKKCCLLKEGE